MPVVYESTGREFTVALRVCDAIITEAANRQLTLTWNIRWADLIPLDIEPGSTFMCTHSFTGSVHQFWPVDKMYQNIRSRNLLCNLVAYSAISNVRVLDGSSSDLMAYTFPNQLAANAKNLSNPTPNSTGTFRTGFLNRMEIDQFNGFKVDKDVNVYNPLAQATQASNYTYTQTFGGLYRCKPREFECVNPTMLNGISITFQDDIPVPKLADLNLNLSGGTTFLANGLWGPQTAGANTITSPGNTAEPVNGFLPQFYTMPPASASNQRIMDLGPPQGTHMFTFRLVRKVNIP
jgi:hypothetical protein